MGLQESFDPGETWDGLCEELYMGLEALATKIHCQVPRS